MNAPVGDVSLRISESELTRSGLGVSTSAKRIVDLLICLLAAPFVLVVGMPIALILKLDGGNIVYAQPRVGANGRQFACLKLRSMVRNADDRLRQMLTADAGALEEWTRFQKLSNDPRITWFGRFLRAYSLDELPQFVNVLRGEMSIVGPRPIMIDQIELYGEQFTAYCAMRPGITGPWQVSGRNERTFAERIRLDSEYAKTWSLAGDLKIMMLTLPAVLAGRGAK
jgi:lipopolysaccharide/colanic/teichoic acid biosynthesis glycosyltransferase